ncbi:T9SS type A sorting domain-containing protein [Neolewinella agarilytica]|nr:T9SS type A sorting domain-containing protein [Neolewinella agarilytica]
MKPFIYLLLSVLFLFGTTLCAQNLCTADPTIPDQAAYLNGNDPSLDPDYVFDASLPAYLNLPVVFHVFSSNDGNTTNLLASRSEIDNAIAEANSFYAPANLGFELLYDPIEYSPAQSQAYLDVDPADINSYGELPYQPNAINVYVVQLIAGLSKNIGNATFPQSVTGQTVRGDQILLKTGFVFNDGNFSHELGHFFGLFHTFQDVGCRLPDPNEDGIELSDMCAAVAACSGYTESNPNFEGDRCVDTPPGFEGTIYNSLDNGCMELCPDLDLSTTSFSTLTENDLKNVMSYSNCKQYLSDDQYARAYWYAVNARQNLLAPQTNASGLYLIAPSITSLTSMENVTFIAASQYQGEHSVNFEYRPQGTTQWTLIGEASRTDPGLLYLPANVPLYEPGTPDQIVEFRVVRPDVAGAEEISAPVTITSVENFDFKTGCEPWADYTPSVNLEVVSVEAGEANNVVEFTWDDSVIPNVATANLDLYYTAQNSWTASLIMNGLNNNGSFTAVLPSDLDLSEQYFLLYYSAATTCPGRPTPVFDIGLDYTLTNCSNISIGEATNSSCTDGTYDLSIVFTGDAGTNYTIEIDVPADQTSLSVTGSGTYTFTGLSTLGAIEISAFEEGNPSCKALTFRGGQDCSPAPVGIPQLFVMSASTSTPDGNRRMNLDGSNAVNFDANFTEWNIDIVEESGKMYTSALINGRLRERNLDGSSPVTYSVGATGFGMAVSETGYFYKNGTGSNPELRFGQLPSTASQRIFGTNATSICVSDPLNTVYWTSTFGSSIRSRPIGGSSTSTVASVPVSLVDARGLSVDHVNEYLYWCNEDLGHICRVKLDGSDFSIVLEGLDEPYDIALSPGTNQLFWTTGQATQKIMVASLDGNDPQLLPNQPVSGPRGIDICFSCGAPQCPSGDVTLSSQEEVDGFITNYPSCTAINGNLTITTAAGFTTNSPIVNLDALANLRTIEGDLIIDNNPNLLNLDGLADLEEITGNLVLSGNQLLSVCSNQAVCELITTSSGSSTVQNNEEGCNSAAQVTASCIALPITLQDFTAVPNGKVVLLRWNTSAEFNHGRFEVHKLNGDEDWTSLATIYDDERNTDNDYSFVDETPAFGENVYRLTQYDLDGTVGGTWLRSASIFSEGEIDVFPNPATSTLHVNGSVSGIEKAEVRKVDGTYLFITKDVATIDVTHLPQGVYLIRFYYGNGDSILKRFIVAR